MRITMDSVPLVLGIYAQVGGLLDRATSRAEQGDSVELGRRFAGARDDSTDRTVKKLVKAVHSEVKTADKLLKKTADIWKLAGDDGRVDLVVHRRGESDDPRAYVLLRPDDVREILRSIRGSAEGASAEPAVLGELATAAEGITGRPSDYYTFGFDPAGE